MTDMVSLRKWVSDWGFLKRDSGSTNFLSLQEQKRIYSWLVVNLEKYSEMEDGISFSILGKCLSVEQAIDWKNELEKKLANEIEDIDILELVANGKTCSELKVVMPILG